MGLRYSAKRAESLVPAGTERVTKALPPTTAPSPITVSPPRIVAPEYMVTPFSTVGWRLPEILSRPARGDRAPKVTP